MMKIKSVLSFFFSFVIILMNIPVSLIQPIYAESNILFSDNFNASPLDINKWTIKDASGYLVLSAWGVLGVGNSYSPATGQWNQTSLTSKSLFPREGLSVSAKINAQSDTLLGYGDTAVQSPNTQAYLIDLTTGYLLATGWDNGIQQYYKNCGAITQGVVYSIKLTATGFDVFVNGGSGDTFVCSMETPSLTNMTNKPIFLQASASMSYIDDVIVSSTSAGVPTPIVPVSPTNLVATGGNEQVSLSWTAPTPNGGPAVTDYVIEYKLSTASSYGIFNDGTSNATSATLTGLANGSTYNFRVAAINSNGTGTFSTIATATTTTPNAPGVLLSDSFSTNIIDTAKWTIKDPSGYQVVSAWDVLGIGNSFSSGQWNQTSLTSKATFPREGLSASAKITVQSDTLFGYGDTNFQSTNTEAYLIDITSWGLLLGGWQNGNMIYFKNCGTAAIAQGAIYSIKPISTGVDLFVNSGSGEIFVCSLETPLMTTMTNKPVFLQALSTMAYVDVVSVTGSGASGPTVIVPNAPTNLSAEGDIDFVDLSWTAPAPNGGPAVTDYVIQYKSSTESSYAVFTDGVGTAASTSVTGLASGSTYDFRVSAVNLDGTSAFSNVASATTLVPNEPSVVLSDSFSENNINNSKWIVRDLVGNQLISNQGVLGVAKSFESGTGKWNRTSLSSKKTFPRENLSLSAKIVVQSDTVMGYGDSNVQYPNSQAYTIDLTSSGILWAMAWHNGNMTYYKNCGYVIVQGATYTINPTASGMDVFANYGSGNTFICSLETPLMTNMTNKQIFFQALSTMSYIDDITVTRPESQEPPQTVTGLTTFATNNQVVLAWHPDPNSDYQNTEYDIEYKLSSEATWFTPDHEIVNPTKVLITGLDNDTNYDFRVITRNAQGSSLPSDIVTAMPANVGDDLAFVFTGESNAGGMGENHLATAAEVAPRSSVQIMNLTSGEFQFEDLDIGVNNLRDHDGISYFYNYTHGLELSLANNVEEGVFPGITQVHLIKTGQGGSTLAGWEPNGNYWSKFLQRINAAKTQIPIERQWVVWYSLGMNDTLIQTSNSDFKSQTIEHINKIKAELPGALIVMTGFESIGESSYTNILNKIAEQDASIFIVDSIGVDMYDEYHWNYQGFKTLGGRMSELTSEVLGL